MFCSKKLFLLTLVLFIATGVSADEEYVEGQKVRKVVKLTSDNFRTAINDPQNSVWFLKFYAYWCGHCKKLAPVLDAAAPQVAGKMAIGKIDCTEEKKLCEEFKVRGYPTLKFSLDGDISDYPGGRKEEDIVAFGEKMSRPTMKLLYSVGEAMDYTRDSTFDHGVSYVCHDPKAVVGSLEQMIESSPLLQVCSQVARQQMAHGHFTALAPSADVTALASTPPAAGGEMTKKAGAFLCRLEGKFSPRCLHADEVKIDTETAYDFVQSTNVESVTQLGPSNFHRIGRLGRKLLIGVANVEDEEMLDEVKTTLTDFARNGSAKSNKKHYLGWMDGKKWSKFLEQFEITQEDLPRYFVLDVPNRVYWQDPTFKGKTLKEFLKAIKDGTIPSQESGGVRGARFLNKIANGFFNWMPWSLFLILGLVTAAIFAVVPDAKALRPPFINQKGGDGKFDPLLGKKKSS